MLYWEENIFTIQYSGMTTDMYLAALMVSRVVNFATSKNMLRAQNCFIETVINTPGPILMGRYIMT